MSKIYSHLIINMSVSTIMNMIMHFLGILIRQWSMGIKYRYIKIKKTIRLLNLSSDNKHNIITYLHP